MGSVQPRSGSQSRVCCTTSPPSRITPADFGLVTRNRIVNLRKIFPYVPERLNSVLLHFSAATEVFYDTVGELCEDVGAALADLAPQAGQSTR